MDLTTHYLGLKLSHPFIPGASPLSQNLDMVKQLEDAGAAAIVIYSLFEERITMEQLTSHESMDYSSEAHSEAMNYFPDPLDVSLGPDKYLKHIQNIKETVDIPVIASLNGTTSGGWLSYAKLIEEAGADALELNVYDVATNPNISAVDIEKNIIEMVALVKNETSIPIAVKLSPFFTSLPHLANELDKVKTDGLIIFNRFYQPNIDIEELEILPFINLSTSDELLLRLRWMAILSAQVNMSLAITGGVQTHFDAIRAIMSGTDAIQLVSCLLRNGANYLKSLKRDLTEWLIEHEYKSLEQMRGNMNLSSCPNPKSYVRSNYMHMLQSWTY